MTGLAQRVLDAVRTHAWSELAPGLVVAARVDGRELGREHVGELGASALARARRARRQCRREGLLQRGGLRDSGDGLEHPGPLLHELVEPGLERAGRRHGPGQRQDPAALFP